MIRALKILDISLVAAVSMITMVACSPSGSSLEGAEWKLNSWTLSSLSPSEFGITAKFQDGRISGNSGVNNYSGPYTLSTGGAVSVGPLVSTEMAGSEPAMRAEGAYMQLLGQANTYKASNGKLTLYDRGGNESLVFQASNP